MSLTKDQEMFFNLLKSVKTDTELKLLVVSISSNVIKAFLKCLNGESKEPKEETPFKKVRGLLKSKGKPALFTSASPVELISYDHKPNDLNGWTTAIKFELNSIKEKKGLVLHSHLTIGKMLYKIEFYFNQSNKYSQLCWSIINLTIHASNR